MIQSILKECAIDKVLDATAAGSGDTLNSAILDLETFDSVCFIATTGDVADTAVGTLKAFCGNAADVSDGAYKEAVASFTAAGATAADNKVVVLDVKEPGKRYVRADFVRATANIPVESIIAIRYNSGKVPVDQPADVVASGLSVG